MPGKNSSVTVLTRILLVAAVYFLTGKAGLALPFIASYVTLIWLPAGVAIAALWIWGCRMAPGVFLGALIVNLSQGSNLPLSLGVSVGNTLGPCLAVWFLRRTGFSGQFERSREVLFFFLAVITGLMIPATVGTASLKLNGIIPLNDLGSAWWTWWLGDTVGALMIGPALLTINRDWLRSLKPRWMEFLILIASLVILSSVVLLQDDFLGLKTSPFVFLSLPLIVWAAIRFGTAGASFCTLLLAAISVWATASGTGPFYQEAIRQGLFLQWVFMSTAVALGLTISALHGEQRASENALHGANRKLRAMSECSQVLVRAENESELLNEICRIVTESGDYLVAWVGYPEHNENKTIKVAACAGRAKHIFEDVKVSWADNEYGNGPTGTAIRTGKPCAIQNIHEDQRVIPWKKLTHQFGHSSICSLPLKSDQQVIGALTVFSEQLKAFPSDTICLLEELASDLAYGISTLRTRQAHSKAEEGLQLFRQLLEHSHDAVFVIDAETHCAVDVNEMACRQRGYSREEMLQLDVKKLCGGQSPLFSTPDGVSRLKSAGSAVFEGSHYRKDGTKFPVEVSASYVEQKSRGYIIAIARDITERKQAQAAIEERLKLETTLSQLIATAPGAAHAFHLLPDGKSQFTYATPALEEIYGIPLDELFRDATRAIELIHPDDRPAVNTKVEASIQNMTPWRAEFRFRNPRRGEIWVEGHSMPQRQPDGSITWQGFLFDITERKLAEQAIKQSEERFRVFADHAADAFFLHDIEGKLLDVNRRACEALGYTREELLKMNVLDVEKNFTREEVDDAWGKILSGQTVTFYGTHTRKDRSRFPTEIRICRFGDNGKTLFLALARDITERKRAELALQTSEENLKRAQAVSHTGSWHLDITDRILEWSDETYRIFGMVPGSGVTPEIFYSKVYPDDRQMVRDGWLLAHKTHHYDVEHRIVVDGNVKWVRERAEVRIDAKGTPLEGVGTVQDITWLKQTQTVLERQRGELQLILDAVPALIFYKDRDHRLINVNRAVIELAGLPRDTILGKTDAELGSPFAAQYCRDEDEIMASGQPKRGLIEQTLTATGTCWLQTDKFPHLNEKGEIIGIIGFSVDITERMRADQAIQERLALEERLSKLASTAPGAIYSYRLRPDGSSCFPYASPILEDLTGIRPEELLEDSSPAFAKVHPDDLKPLLDSIQDAAKNVSMWLCSFRVNHPKKGVVWIEGRSMPQKETDGSITWHGFMLDITPAKQAEVERQKLEIQLRQAQKLEAIGTLAGGIAHDFNNILGAILGNAELAMMDLAPDQLATISLKEILSASNRGKNLVQQILTFARQQKPEKKIIALTPVLEESTRLLRATLPAGICLNLKCQADTPDILADTTQIQQIVMNLCTNAWHALHNNQGQISIRLDAVELEQETTCTLTHLRPGRYARLTVTDNGKGIPHEVLDHIFEPFFTTKAPGEGTGLGLAAVHGIVTAHQGGIKVSSELGKGSAFEIFFPAANAKAQTESDSADEKTHGSSEHILFLDDEEALGFLAKRMLQRLGYKISVFSSAKLALEAFRDAPDSFDLVITDFNMPGTSGLEVAREVLSLNPDIPIILSSGYITDDLREKALEIGIKDLLYKPNSIGNLSETIHRLIREAKHKRH